VCYFGIRRYHYIRGDALERWREEIDAMHRGFGDAVAPPGDCITVRDAVAPEAQKWVPVAPR
jgi:hypothetical protein